MGEHLLQINSSCSGSLFKQLQIKRQHCRQHITTEDNVGQAFQEFDSTEIDEFDLHGLCVDREIEYLDVPMEDPREQQTTAASITCSMK